MTTESIITLTPKAITKVEDILAKEKSKTAMLRVVAMPSPGGSIQYMFAIEENSAEKLIQSPKEEYTKQLIKAASTGWLESLSLDNGDMSNA